MFSSAGFSSPRGPFAGAAPLAHRPLSAIAATAAGGVPQARIQRLIAELIPVLDDLHREGHICGDISVHSVGLDESGRAHLMALSGYSRPGEAPALTPGYVPFELYTEAPEWPRGPWTDIYALSAVAYSLVAGQRPPAASERRVSETYRPLIAQGLAKYDASFLAAIDAGLAIMPANRPQTVQEFAQLLALPPPVRPSQPEPLATELPEPTLAAEASSAPRRGSFRSIAQAILLGIATLAVSAYWWGRLTDTPDGVITHSESAVAQAPTSVEAPVSTQPAPAPEPSLAAPVAAVPQAEWQTGYPVEDTGALAQSAGRAPDDASTEPSDQDGASPPAPPAPVRVSINVRPWGEIVVNGVSRGVTPPLKTLRLAPGRYSVTIRNTAQPPYRTTLEVKPGKPAMITHIFR